MPLSGKARIYIAVAAFAGFALGVRAALDWTSTDPLRFLAYVLVTAIASGLKVTLPGIKGTMSVSYIFILASVIQLSFGEAVSISILAALVQCFWQARERPQTAHIVFNASTLAISTALAYQAYHAWPTRISMIFALISAGGAYFLGNTLAIAGIVAVTERKAVMTLWRTSYFWSFPYYLLGASLAACMSYLSRFLNWEISLVFLPMVFIIYRSYGLYLRQLEEKMRHAESTASLHLRTIEALALAIDAKDHTTAEHLKRVRVYAREIATDLGLSEDEKLALQAASILHDVGKIAVPDYIISKPGKLSREEFEKMKIHPVIGAEILERIDFPYPVAPIVRAHHEKWDGSGYPLGLQREQIPIGARILTAVDCFDALASDRQYRKALPLDQAMDVVRKEAGKSFDPRVVEVLGRRYPQLEELASAEQTPEQAKLSLGLKIDRGDSPDAGFEANAPAIAPGQERREEAVSSVANAQQQAEALYQFSRKLGDSLNLTEMLAVIATRISALVPYDALAIYVIEGEVLVPQYVFGENYKLLSSLRVPLGQGVSGWVAEHKRSILNGNPAVEPGYLNDSSRSAMLRSVLAVPLQSMSATIGVLAVYKSEEGAFSRDHLRILIAMNTKISLTIENSLSNEHANIQTLRDVVTGLPNTSALFLRIETELERCKSSNSRLTIFVCDLEGFELVNDVHGDVTASNVIQLIATGFQENCRDVDYLARTGVSEFVFVLPSLTHESVDRRISELSAVVHRRGFETCGTNFLSISVGFATFPQDGSDSETLLAEADRRMYLAKRSYRSDAVIDAAGDALARLRNSVEQDAPP